VAAHAIRAGKADPAPIPPNFWPAFWALVDAPPGALDAGGVTTQTAQLGGLLADELKARVAPAALAFPGVAQAAAQGWPERFTLEALARCPQGSLGGDFHSLIVDNGFDLEVLDRDALGLSGLAPPLDYLNARILQCHDLWHIVGGYRTTGLHEVAISAFQLGQFGHHYSAMFLAMALAKSAQHGLGSPVLLDTIATAWVHGRESPPLLGVDWPAVWDLPVDRVRARVGIVPYASPWPADLFEQLAAA
jgi:ubiquinone biosynthesis protein Coq4